MKWADSRPASLRLSSSPILAIIAHLIFGLSVSGQELRFERNESPFEVLDINGEPYQLPFLGGFSTPRPQFVDIDGDGDQDLFVQDNSDQLIFFEHLSETTGFPFVKRSDSYLDLRVGEWYRFVDLDGDGDRDLLAEAPFSFIRVYENTGSASMPAFSLSQDSLRDHAGAPIFADRQNILDAVDIDVDNKVDLFIGRLDGSILRYEQSESGVSVRDLAFTLQNERFQNISVIGEAGKRKDRHGANTLLFFDVDEDDDYDLFWGDFFEEGLLIFENEGSPQIPLYSTDLVRFPIGNPVQTSGYNAPAFGDINRDGLPDFLIGVLGGAFSSMGGFADNLLYYVQGVDGQFSLERTRFFSNIDLGSDSYPVLFDVDQDGDIDLIMGNSIDPANPNAAALHFFENVGNSENPKFQELGTLPLNPPFSAAPTLGDLNNDGAVDMLVGSFLGEMTLYWNSNSGNGLEFSHAIPGYLDIPSSGSSTPYLVDLDADGDLDLLVGQSSGSINYFENKGTPQQPQFSLITSSFASIDVGRRSAPIAVDIDRDGDFDLLVGSDFEGIRAYENIGTPQVAEFEQVSLFEIEIERRMVPAWGDLNGDTYPELLTGLLDGGIHYFGNPDIGVSSQPEREASPLDLDMYPNPAINKASVVVEGVRSREIEIYLYTPLGQLLQRAHQGAEGGEVVRFELDVSAYASGCYVVQVQVKNRTLSDMLCKVASR